MSYDFTPFIVKQLLVPIRAILCEAGCPKHSITTLAARLDACCLGELILRSPHYVSHCIAPTPELQIADDEFVTSLTNCLAQRGLTLNMSLPDEILIGLAEEKRLRDPLFEPISILELPIRAERGAEQAGAHCIASLTQLLEGDLLTQKHFGVESLAIIKYRLKELNLSLGMSWSNCLAYRYPHQNK